jgi:hypothetical protein
MAAPTNPADLAAKASFVFRGTVQQLNASTLPEVGDKSKTAIVRVDETMQAPQVLSHYTGQNITVQLAAPIAVGEQAVFYTNAWLFGNDGVAVRSMGHAAPGLETLALHAAGSDPVTNLENRDAQVRFDAAEMVISGTVSSVRTVPEAEPARGPSEHDPDWREATIEISETHKGDSVPKEVVVRFPASHDRMWQRVPKLKPGDTGKFVLHKPAGEAAGFYSLLGVEDFEPESKPGPMHRLVAKLEAL